MHFVALLSLVGQPAAAEHMNKVVSFVAADDRAFAAIEERSIIRAADGTVEANVAAFTRLPDMAAAKGLAITNTVPSWTRTIAVKFDCGTKQFAAKQQTMFSDTWHVVVDMTMPVEMSAPRPMWRQVLDHACLNPAERAEKKLAVHQGLRAFAEAGRAYYETRNSR